MEEKEMPERKVVDETCPVCGKVDCTDPVCRQGKKICEEHSIVGNKFDDAGVDSHHRGAPPVRDIKDEFQAYRLVAGQLITAVSKYLLNPHSDEFFRGMKNAVAAFSDEKMGKASYNSPKTATEAVYLDSQERKRKYFESLENEIANLQVQVRKLKKRFDAHELDYEHANLANEPVDPRLW